MGHTVGALFAWVCSVLKTVVVGHGEFQASVCVLERGVGREREISNLELSWAPGVLGSVPAWLSGLLHLFRVL